MGDGGDGGGGRIFLEDPTPINPRRDNISRKDNPSLRYIYIYIYIQIYIYNTYIYIYGLVPHMFLHGCDHLDLIILYAFTPFADMAEPKIVFRLPLRFSTVCRCTCHPVCLSVFIRLPLHSFSRLCPIPSPPSSLD